jgi:hypothetical protein
VRRALRKLATLTAPVVVVAACTAGEAPPTTASYTVKFPSTAAAVATDQVQLLVFPVAAAEREVVCPNLIQARKRRDPLSPVVTGPVVNICEMLRGVKPITVPYGEHAVLAVAIRKGVDYMLGCQIHTFGDAESDATALAVPVALIDVGQPVPDTNCTNVSDFCNNVCKAN